jgi:hypothetical protein
MKYKISKSLNGDEIIYLARVGKQQKLVMRADSEAKLVKLMAESAKQFDDELAAKEAAKVAKAEPAPKKGKKLGVLWKPGKLLQDQTLVEAEKVEAEKTTPAKKPLVSKVEDLN